MRNDPLNASDPTGTSVKLSGTEEDRKEYREILQQDSGIPLEENADGTTTQSGPRNPKKGYAPVADALTTALEASEVITINLVQDSAIFGDNFATREVDVSDQQRFHDESNKFGAGQTLHILTEYTYAQQHGGGTDNAAYAPAHAEAIRVESQMMGASSRKHMKVGNNIRFVYIDQDGFLHKTYKVKEK